MEGPAQEPGLLLLQREREAGSPATLEGRKDSVASELPSPEREATSPAYNGRAVPIRCQPILRLLDSQRHHRAFRAASNAFSRYAKREVEAIAG
jgi:hypothetical protein